jgi:hypothetical protein
MKNGHEAEKKELFQKVRDVLRDRYWNKLVFGARNTLSKDKVSRPVHDVFEYVYSAWESDLDKRSETAYSGSVFLYSVLKGTGRRFTSDVTEANELHEVGKELASFVWEKLEKSSSGKDVRNGDGTLAEIWYQFSEYLWEEFKSVKFRRMEEEK